MDGWVCWADETVAGQLTPPGPPLTTERVIGTVMSPAAFEDMARKALSKHYGMPLAPGRAPGVPKLFDLVSADWQVVGDAKYFTLVGGERMPPAKFSLIAEHVWLLEKTGAPRTFLVFGNDRRVPEIWLKRYGHLARQVVFYFLSDEGQLQILSADDKAR